MNEFDLLKKNELRFRPVILEGADLNQIAASIAKVLQLEAAEVLVTDYLDRVLTLDILRSSIYPHQLLAKKEPLLAALAAIPGVRLEANTGVFSEGMLGWIAANAEDAAEALENAELMSASIRERLAKRAMVFSTGAEVLKGEIKDTNSISLADALRGQGYSVTFGGTLRDDCELIAGSLRKAVFEGYSLLVTTGGVGAESKDCTVEAVLELDPEAATPYICTFAKGHGRHVKDGVRIAVGELDDALIVSLPGPNDEVRASLDLLLHGLKLRPGKQRFAESLAANLRDTLRQKMRHHPQSGAHPAH